MRALAMAAVLCLAIAPSAFAAASHSVVLGAASCSGAKGHDAKCPPPAAMSSVGHDRSARAESPAATAASPSTRSP